MRISVLLCLLIVIVSCGKAQEAENQDKRLGQFLTIDNEDKLSQSELNLLKSACRALESKKEFFKRYYVNKKSFNGELSYRECGQELSSKTNFSAPIKRSGNEIILDTNDDNIMQELLTDESNLLEDYCLDAVDENNLRHRAYGSFATWIYPYKGVDPKCGARSDTSMCLYFMTGQKGANKSSYQIREQELIRISLGGGASFGVVSDRKLTSSVFCRSSQESETKIQKLISIN